MIKTLMRKDLSTMCPYEAPFITEGIKIDANENTYPVHDVLREHMIEWMKTMPINLYPDTTQATLRQALGEAYDFPPEQIICGVGSDQLIDCILRAFLDRDDVVVAPAPSFSMYELTTKLNGGRFMTVPLKDDFQYDEEAFLNTIQEVAPKVIFICNPNNPTGTPIPLEAIERLTRCSIGIVVVDEAYAEFSGETALSLVKRYPNVIVLRTFSKAYGLAGARVGYGIASPELIRCLNRIRPPYNLNAFTQEVATFVVTHRVLFAPMIEKICNTRQRTEDALRELGFEVIPSAANFLWVASSWPLDQWLKESKIYIKRFMFSTKQYFRISIGTDTEMTEVLTTLQELIQRVEKKEAPCEVQK